MPNGGYISDRGVRGLVYHDQRVRTAGSSWFELVGGTAFFADFTSGTLDDMTAVAIQATGGTRFAFNTNAGLPVAAHGGWVRGTTGTAVNDTEELHGPAIWRPDRAGNGMLVFETRLALLTAADRFIQAGLTNTAPQTPFRLGAGDTITSNAVSGAVWIFDTAATTDNWFGVNVNNNIDGVLTPPGGIAPTANTVYILRIEVDSLGQCYYYFDDSQKSGGVLRIAGADTTGITPTTAHLPAVVSGITNTTAKSADVDYVLVACQRAL